MSTKPLALAVAVVGFVAGFTSILNQQQYFNPVLPVKEKHLSSARILGEVTTIPSDRALSVVYGFLPYWNLSNYQLNPALTHLAYFSLGVTGTGELNTRADPGWNGYQSQRWQDLQAQARGLGIKTEVTFFSAEPEAIAELLACPECQSVFLDQLAEVLTSGSFSGVNLDLEYVGEVELEQREQFTALVTKVWSLLQRRFPGTKLSLDVYGGAARSDNIWDLPALAQVVDYIIVMGYDYRTRTATTAGPTAPVLGKPDLSQDIWNDLELMLQAVPGQQIILAVPFYGYAWATTSPDLAEAKTYQRTGATLTYKRAQEILADPDLAAQELWHAPSLTPYLVWQNKNQTYLGFFENEASLNYKIDLVTKLKLGGLAIWALGYEGEHGELWDTIAARR